MSNKQNDILLEQVVEYVRERMNENGTIPEEAFNDLVRMEYQARLEVQND